MNKHPTISFQWLAPLPKLRHGITGAIQTETHNERFYFRDVRFPRNGCSSVCYQIFPLRSHTFYSMGLYTPRSINVHQIIPVKYAFA